MNTEENNLTADIPCKPTNMITLVFPFFGVKDGFPGSSILHNSLNTAYIRRKENLLKCILPMKSIQ